MLPGLHMCTMSCWACLQIQFLGLRCSHITCLQSCGHCQGPSQTFFIFTGMFTSSSPSLTTHHLSLVLLQSITWGTILVQTISLTWTPAKTPPLGPLPLLSPRHPVPSSGFTSLVASTSAHGSGCTGHLEYITFPTFCPAVLSARNVSKGRLETLSEAPIRRGWEAVEPLRPRTFCEPKI